MPTADVEFSEQTIVRARLEQYTLCPQKGARMTMRIDPGEFRARPLRVHALLHDVPLEDAWAIPLPGGGAGRTIQDLRALMTAGRQAAPVVVRVLFLLRNRIGALLGWYHRRPVWD